jgi:hypothetical protein
LGAGLDEVPDVFGRALHSSRDLVNILRLDHSLQVILKHLREIV